MEPFMDKKIFSFLFSAAWLAGSGFSALGQDSAALFQTGRIRLVEVARTTDAALPDEAMFRNPRYLAVDAKGNVYVSDWAANHIKVFDQDGKFLRTIGRPGNGPGDLSGPAALDVSGDRLVVWESMNGRFTILKLDGTFVKTAPRLQGSRADLYALKALPDGRFVAFLDKGLPPDYEGQLPSERTYAVLLLSPDLTVVKTIFEKSIRRRNWFQHPQTGAIGQASFPYHPDIVFDLSPSGFAAVGYSQTYEVGLYDPDKGRVSEINRAYDPVKIEEKDRKAHFNAFTLRVLVGNKMDTVQGAPDYVVKATEFPENFPPYRGISFDGRGNLWVQIYPADRATNVFDVFSSDGRFLNRVTVDGARIEAAFSSHVMMRFSGDFLWLIEKDADDYASLVKYRMTAAR
jgi:hypothetical protein